MMWHARNRDDIGRNWLRQRLTAAAQAVFGAANDPLQTAQSQRDTPF